jgi:tetratricopeptide (TPR) repeat protein
MRRGKLLNRLLTNAAKLAAILTLAAVTAACSDFARGFREGLTGSDAPAGIVNQIEEHNQAGYDLIEEGKYEEGIARLKQAVELVYEVHPDYETLETSEESSEVFDAPFNNMSWAYNELGEYEESLYWIEKALLLLPNSDIEYVNKGNALYGLNRKDEAQDFYDLAIEKNEDSISAYYGRGMIYYDEGSYSDAADAFNRYLSLDSSDYDAAEMLLYSLIGQEKEEDALAFAEKWLGDYPERFEAYQLKMIALDYTSDFEELETFAIHIAETFPELPEAQELPGELYYDHGYYDESIAYFRKMRDKNVLEPSSLIWLIRNYSAKQDYASAEKEYAQAQSANPENAELSEAMGDMYSEQTMYDEAARYYETAAGLDPQNGWYAEAMLSALYSANRVDKCAEYGKSLLSEPRPNTGVAWYTGLCQLDRGDYNGSIEAFEAAVAADSEDYSSYAQLAYAHLLSGNDEEAGEYAAASLALYEEEPTALYVEQELKERERPLSERVEEFFRENYLYREASDRWDEAFAGLSRGASPQEIAETVERAKNPDDPFTFVIYGEDYDYLSSLGGDESIAFREEGDLLYLSILTFDETTDNRFIEILDGVEDPESKRLVLDLRGNSGGLADSANRMLDALLQDYVASTMIYSDGSTESYYSDSSALTFESIYVLVDEGTASAAELMTLGLKTYLPNVTIIGRETYGKGVGQVVFEDREAKIMVLVVNFYWNVKQTNIADTRIQPDIYVKGNAIDSFMKPIREGR